MNPTPVPDSAKRAYDGYKIVDMGPPPGVADEDCGHAEMILGDVPAMPGFPGRDQLVFFKPSPEELEALNNGAYLMLNQLGSVVQPFSLSIWEDK